MVNNEFRKKERDDSSSFRSNPNVPKFFGSFLIGVGALKIALGALSPLMGHTQMLFSLLTYDMTIEVGTNALK